MSDRNWSSAPHGLGSAALITTGLTLWIMYGFAALSLFVGMLVLLVGSYALRHHARRRLIYDQGRTGQ